MRTSLTVLWLVLLRTCDQRGGGLRAQVQARLRSSSVHAGGRMRTWGLFGRTCLKPAGEHVAVADNHIGITGHFHRQTGDMDLLLRVEHATILGTTSSSVCGKSRRARDALRQAIL